MKRKVLITISIIVVLIVVSILILWVIDETGDGSWKDPREDSVDPTDPNVYFGIEGNNTSDKIFFGFSTWYQFSDVDQICAVYSGYTVFAPDDVTLDIYYGSHALGATNEEYYLAVYVGEFNVTSRYTPSTIVESYKNVEGMYLVDIITPERVAKGPYDVDIRCSGGDNLPHFRFKKTYTLPSELFEEEKGALGFKIAWLAKTDGGYQFRKVSRIAGSLSYTTTEDGDISFVPHRSSIL